MCWYVSLPPECSQNCCSVTGEGRDQGPGVTTGCSMQKTLQNWAGACSKIIRKVRTLQCCSDGLSQLGDLCFVPGDLYSDLEILHDIASEMEWLEGEGPLSSLIQNEMNIFGFDMDLVFIFAEESIQKQVKSKKADLLCLNRIETDEHLYYNHDFKLVLVQLSLCWGKTILYVHIPVLPSHHLKLTKSKLYHCTLHIWLLLQTYTMRTHSMFVFIFVACHIPSQTFPYQEHGAKLHPMSEFNNY